ncbi:MAG: glycerol-3-phosphate 1-O-acyltransferase PlsY [Ruminococcaceae bacterium]|nr:glycerol-3-phosphate 1-O-acyltransferase PlsY [Oscillospiraceae bacterium]
MTFFLNSVLPVILLTVVPYLLGSISFSIIFSKLFGKGDIRNYGSGNAGATNVLRSVGALPAALTFLFDFLKCAFSVYLGYMAAHHFCVMNNWDIIMSECGKYIAGFICMVGHMHPIFFGFKGGKGVTTLAAMAILIDIRTAAILLAIFIIIVVTTKYVSLGSCVVSALFPVMTFVISYFFGSLQSGSDITPTYLITVTLAAAAIGGIIVYKHRANIKRLINGTESKFSVAKKDK